MQVSAATVVALLEQTRIQKGVSRGQLASLSGWSQGTLFNIAVKPESVKLAQLFDIAEALGVQITLEIDKILLK